MQAETQSLERQVSSQDRQRLEQYFSAVRAVEVRLKNAAAWDAKPKPQVAAEPPGPLPPVNDVIGRARMMYDLIHLALQTDSTRLITLSLDQVGAVPPIPGVTDAYHQLSHHGQEPSKIAQLRLIARGDGVHVRVERALGELNGASRAGRACAARRLVDEDRGGLARH